MISHLGMILRHVFKIDKPPMAMGFIFSNVIQLMHSFSVNIRISQPLKVMFTSAAPIVLFYDTVSLFLVLY